MDAKEYGAYLKSLRKTTGLTLTQLGGLIGYSNPYLSQIENGQKGIPSPDILRKLSTSLEVDYATLMHKAGYLDDGSLIINGKLTQPKDQVMESLIMFAEVNGSVTIDGIEFSFEQVKKMKELIQQAIDRMFPEQK